MSTITALPEVDLRHSPGQLRERLREAAHEVGFFYLTGHGVSGELTRRVLAAAGSLPDVKAVISIAATLRASDVSTHSPSMRASTWPTHWWMP